MSNNKLAEGIQSAISAHAKWKLILQAAITVGHSKLNIRDVSCNNNCAFGKWLESDDFGSDLREGVPFRVINRLHTDFHKCAGDVLALATTERATEATILLDGEFTAKSDKLMRGLRKWQREVT